MSLGKLFEMVRYFFTRRLPPGTETFVSESIARYDAMRARLSGHYVSDKELSGLTREWEPVH